MLPPKQDKAIFASLTAKAVLPNVSQAADAIRWRRAKSLFSSTLSSPPPPPDDAAVSTLQTEAGENEAGGAEGTDNATMPGLPLKGATA